MSKGRVVVRDRLSDEEARRAMLALVAMGLDAEAERERRTIHGPAGEFDEAGSSPADVPMRVSAAETITWRITVAEDDAEKALPLVADEFVSAAAIDRDADAEGPPAPVTILAPADEIWTWKNLGGTLAIAALCIALHLVVHGGTGPSSHSRMVDAGAAAPWLIRGGQWWRLLTAVFLHFDVEHLVGNMSALLLLAPPLAASIGQSRLVALFLATGVFGNLASQLLGEPDAIKAGASGGICGILGALAGVALATMAAASDPRERRPAWQTLGALVALFGMIVGFQPGRDHYAHVGGLVAGLALGRFFGAGRTPIAQPERDAALAAGPGLRSTSVRRSVGERGTRDFSNFAGSRATEDPS